MKKAFTLIELLVVVFVIAILMTIVFRLAGIGGDAQRRNQTIVRLERLENCLSGYFAAFGSYPPVPTQASRNVYAELDEDGNQRDSGETSNLRWDNVNKACRAQPFAARFPFAKSMDTYVDNVSRIMSQRASSSDGQWKAYRDRAKCLAGGFHAFHNLDDANEWQTEAHWDRVKIFQFGLMSYLLPHYMFMASGIDESQVARLSDCAQWTANNRLSSNPNTGGAFGNWKDQFDDKRLLRRIPSQAACARWVANLKGIVDTSSANAEFFGVRVWSGYCELHPDNPYIDVYLDQNRTVLDSMTVRDGWSREFYYYSPAPYQIHRLWSAGANGKTFAPWVSLDTLPNADRKTAANWMGDDIEFLNH